MHDPDPKKAKFENGKSPTVNGGKLQRARECRDLVCGFIFWFPSERSAKARGKQLVSGTEYGQTSSRKGAEPVRAVRNLA
jgi:hypothetical protein